jgi:uncharacterized protein YjiS (DUF1127 family)
MLAAFYAGRAASAAREIERRRDLIARLRRGQVERKQHLVAVPQPDETAPALGERWGAGFAAGRRIMARWQRRVRMRNELATLSDGDLCDVRWTRAEAEAERRKPFWRA